MTWLFFVLGAVCAWGLYGPALHIGQAELQSSALRAFLCVGAAYFLVAVLVPTGILSATDQPGTFTPKGVGIAIFAGALGATGALCIILSFINGGRPLYVMPLVFGGAPLVNVIASVILHPPKSAPSPWLYVGFLLVAVGAGLVLRFKPV